MRYIKPSAEINFLSILEHQKKVSKNTKAINKLSACIDWEDFRKDLELILEYTKRDQKREGVRPLIPYSCLKY